MWEILTVYCICSRQLTHFECPDVFYVTLISEVSFQFICTVRTKIGYCSCHCLYITYLNVTAVADSDLEVMFSRSVHNAALYTSVRPDLQIRICHFVLVWVLSWRGTEVNPMCGNIKANNFLLIVSLRKPCHKFEFDQFSVTAFSFFRMSVTLLKHLFLFQLTSDWNVAFRFAEETGFLIRDLPVPLICHKLLKKSISLNTSSIYQGIVCNTTGEQWSVNPLRKNVWWNLSIMEEQKNEMFPHPPIGRQLLFQTDT